MKQKQNFSPMFWCSKIENVLNSDLASIIYCNWEVGLTIPIKLLFEFISSLHQGAPDDAVSHPWITHTKRCLCVVCLIQGWVAPGAWCT